MSNKKKIWGGILLVCLILTLWQIPDFKVLWREYKTIKFIGQGNDASIYSTSLINSEAPKADPEAYDILNYLISKPDINELATLVLKYPENELFGYELTNKLLKTDSIYPQAILNAANRLINANPRNAHFHYLKASILLSLQNEGNFDEAIKEIEIGNNAPEFYFAYNKYQDRLLTLFKSGTPSKVPLRFLQHQELESYYELKKRLTLRAEQAIKHSDLVCFQNLSDIGIAIGERIIEHAGNPSELLVGSNFIGSMAGLKLKEIKPPADIEQVRFQSCRVIAILDIVRELSDDTWHSIFKLVIIAVLVLVPSILSVYIFLFWILVFIVSLIRKQLKTVKAGFLNYFLFAFSLVYFIVLHIVFSVFLSDNQISTSRIQSDFIPDETNSLPLVALILSISLWVIFCIMSLLPPYDKKKLYRFWISKAIICAAIWLTVLIIALVPSVEYEIGSWQGYLYGLTMWFIICAVLWLISIYGWFLLRCLPYRWLTTNRCVQLILIITFLAALNILVNEIDWLQILIIFLLISCSALIVTHNPIGKMTNLVDALFYFFSKNEQIATTRAKILCLLSPYLVFFWLVFLISTLVFIPMLSRLDRTITNPLANYEKLPLANESTYQSVINKIDLSQIESSSTWKTGSRSNVLRYLSIVTRQDLPPILAKLKEFDSPLEDSELLRIMERCNSDVYDIIVDSLEYPESEEALIVRAKSGDITVKEKLEQLFEEKLSKMNPKDTVTNENQSYRRHDQRHLALDHCWGIASALAAISEPDEAKKRFIDIIDNIDDLTVFADDLFSLGFYIRLNGLIRPQTTEVLKAYLNKTDFSDLTEKRSLFELTDALSSFADTELAEKIFVRTCEFPLVDKPFDFSINYVGFNKEVLEELNKPRDWAIELRKAISPYFSKSSIAILKKELNSDNPNIRAYVVWQLTKLGYEWSEQELEQLSTDEDWKVRLNTLFAMDEKSARTAFDDENPVVRVTAKLIVEKK